MNRMALSVLTALTVVVFFAPSAFPDTITWTDTQYAAGTGFGNITYVLSLANKTSETGSVYPASQTTGDATNSSKTWTVTQLVESGFSANNLGIVFNINEPGSAGTVNLVSFSTGFPTDFFNTGANVLGGSGSVTDSFSGAENFYLARTDFPHTIIPEASAVFLFGTGLGGLVAYRRKRRMA